MNPRRHLPFAKMNSTDARTSSGESWTDRKAGLSCAECRRSKLKCDRVFPCQSCIRRGCAHLCPNGTLAATKGNKVLMAHANRLTEQVKILTKRVHELESALASRGQYRPEDHSGVDNVSAEDWTQEIQD